MPVAGAGLPDGSQGCARRRAAREHDADQRLPGRGAAAAELNRQVRRDPEPQTIVQLGYLVGAVQEAEASTGGIHQDLKLRLDSAARYNGPGEKPFSAAFERAFGEGYAAGQAAG